MIDELRYYFYTLAFPPGGYTMSRGRHLSSMDSSIVAVRDADGVTGFGESCTLGSAYLVGFREGVEVAVRKLAPTVVASDPMGVDRVATLMDSLLLGHYPAKAAIDAALWDWRGKALGYPVGELLGGIHQFEFPTYYAVTHGTPDEMCIEAEAMAARGFVNWQLKLGYDPIEDALATRAVVDTLGKRCRFMSCDANGAWSSADAIRYARAVGSADVYLEQPCQTLQEMAAVAGKVGLPMIADESIVTERDILECVSLGSAEAINIKPARVGGITRASRLRDLAQGLGLRVVIDDAMGGQLASAALAHLAGSTRPEYLLGASQRAVTHFQGGANLMMATSLAVQAPVGSGSVAREPGLGVDVQERSLGDPIFTEWRRGAKGSEAVT